MDREEKMSKDPGHSSSEADRQGSRIRELEEEVSQVTKSFQGNISEWIRMFDAEREKKLEYQESLALSQQSYNLCQGENKRLTISLEQAVEGLQILRRYHAGDGTISRDQVIFILGEDVYKMAENKKSALRGLTGMVRELEASLKKHKDALKESIYFLDKNINCWCDNDLMVRCEKCIHVEKTQRIIGEK